MRIGGKSHPLYCVFCNLTLTLNAACGRNQNGKSEIPISKSHTNSKSTIRNPKPPLPAKRPRAGPQQILTSSMPLRPPLSLPPFLPSSLSPTFLCFGFRILFQTWRTMRASYTRKLYSYSSSLQWNRPPPVGETLKEADGKRSGVDGESKSKSKSKSKTLREDQALGGRSSSRVISGGQLNRNGCTPDRPRLTCRSVGGA